MVYLSLLLPRGFPCVFSLLLQKNLLHCQGFHACGPLSTVVNVPQQLVFPLITNSPSLVGLPAFSSPGRGLLWSRFPLLYVVSNVSHFIRKVKWQPLKGMLFCYGYICTSFYRRSERFSASGWFFYIAWKIS